MQAGRELLFVLYSRALREKVVGASYDFPGQPSHWLSPCEKSAGKATNGDLVTVECCNCCKCKLVADCPYYNHMIL